MAMHAFCSEIAFCPKINEQIKKILKILLNKFVLCSASDDLADEIIEFYDGIMSSCHLYIPADIPELSYQQSSEVTLYICCIRSENSSDLRI